MKRWLKWTLSVVALGVLSLGSGVETAQAQVIYSSTFGQTTASPAQPMQGHPHGGNPNPNWVVPQAPQPIRQTVPVYAPVAPVQPISLPGVPTPVAEPVPPFPPHLANDAPVLQANRAVMPPPPRETTCIFPTADACAMYSPWGGLMGGASLYFLKPYFDDNTAYTITTGLGAPAFQQTNVHYDWDLKLAPAIWLGWTSPSGLGVRARYFHFEHSSDQRTETLGLAQAANSFLDPAPGLPFAPGAFFTSPGALLGAGFGRDFLTFSSDMSLQILDAEATYELLVGNCSLLVSGGGRYLHLSQNYSASLRNSFIDNGLREREEQDLLFGHNFNGAGPTAAVQARLPIVGEFSLYGLARGSLLVCTARQDLAMQFRLLDPNGLAGGNAIRSTGVFATRDALLPIAELELGFDYGMTLGNARPFVRGALVNQTYFGAGSASTESGNLSLFGFQLSLGVNY